MNRLLLSAAVLLVALPVAAQQHDMSAMKGQAATTAAPAKAAPKLDGYDLKKATHHFKLFSDGGKIEIDANDAADQITISHIRVQLNRVADMFAEGDFSTSLAVHNTKVPGTAELKKMPGQ